MSILWAVILVLLVTCLWALNLFGVPGNWLVLLATAAYAYFLPSDGPVGVGWLAVGVMFGLALVGEAIELLASAVGVRRYGGSRRGAVLALLGGMVGSVAGALVGIPTLPVPIVGSLVAALFFAAVGATAGAILGEQWVGRRLDDSCRVGLVAFFGRLVGTAGKMVVGAVMIAIVLAAVTLKVL